MSKPKEIIPPISALIPAKKDQRRIQTRMERLAEITYQMADLKIEADALKEELSSMIPAPKAAYDNYVYSIHTGSTSGIKRDVLVARGVDPGIIQEATWTTTYNVISVKNVVIESEKAEEHKLAKARSVLQAAGEL